MAEIQPGGVISADFFFRGTRRRGWREVGAPVATSLPPGLSTAGVGSSTHFNQNLSFSALRHTMVLASALSSPC